MKTKNFESGIADILHVFGAKNRTDISMGKLKKTRNTYIVPGVWRGTWQEAVGAIRAIVELFPGHDITHTDESMEFTTEVDGLTMSCHMSIDNNQMVLDIDPTVSGHYIAYKQRTHTFAVADPDQEWWELEKSTIEVSSLLQETVSGLDEEDTTEVFKLAAKLLLKKAAPSKKCVKKKSKKAK